MDLDLNPPEADVLQRVSARSAAVGRAVAETIHQSGAPMDRLHFDNASDDPFAFDLAIHDSKDLSYEAGISLAVQIQEALRKLGADGWRVRILTQPDAEDLVLDYVTWLTVDLVRVTEYRGARNTEMFKSIEAFKAACWGATAA